MMNPHDISLVRFVILFLWWSKWRKSNKDQKQQSQEVKGVRSRTTLTHTSESIMARTEERNQPKKENNGKKVTKRSFFWETRKPSFYFPLVIVFILLFLLVVGRAATILYTTTLWYVIFFRRGTALSQRKIPIKKKGYVQESSEKKNVTSNERVKKKNFVKRRWWWMKVQEHIHICKVDEEWRLTVNQLSFFFFLLVSIVELGIRFFCLVWIHVARFSLEAGWKFNSSGYMLWVEITNQVFFLFLPPKLWLFFLCFFFQNSFSFILFFFFPFGHASCFNFLKLFFSLSL